MKPLRNSTSVSLKEKTLLLIDDLWNWSHKKMFKENNSFNMLQMTDKEVSYFSRFMCN